MRNRIRLNYVEHPNAAGGVRRKATVIVGVLVIVVVLALLAYRYLDLMSQQSRAGYNQIRATQAKSLARAGVNYTAMLLSNPDAFATVLGGNPFDNPNVFHQQIIFEGELGVGGQGFFSVIAPPNADLARLKGEAYRFGVIDETAKININGLMKNDRRGNVLYQFLLGLPNMDESLAARIVDWVDNDNEVRQGGAENSTYTALDPPYRAKNGPLDSLDELLLVDGMTPEILYGSDLNRNGMIDPDEPIVDNDNPLGLSAYLTVYGREQNLSAAIMPRIAVNSMTLPELQTALNEAGLPPEVVTYILLYRYYGGEALGSENKSSDSTDKSSGSSSSNSGTTGTITMSVTIGAGGTLVLGGTKSSGGDSKGSSNKSSDEPKYEIMGVAAELPAEVDLSKVKRTKSIRSFFSLIDTQVKVPGKSSKEPTKIYHSPFNDPASWSSMLPPLLDQATTSSRKEFTGRINVNTAPEAVLRALANVKTGRDDDDPPVLTDAEVDQILQARPDPGSVDLTSPLYQTPAWLLSEAKLKPATLRNLERYVTTSSQVYRFQVLSYFDVGGPAARVEAVIDTNGGRPRILHYRDLTVLGKGFNLVPLN